MTRIRVDQADVTLSELADVEAALGCSLGVAFDRSQAKAIAALAWISQRRADPLFTFAQALELRMSDLEIVAPESPGEAPGGDNGVSPPGSPDAGQSTRSP